LEVYFPGRKDNQLKNRHKLPLRRANKAGQGNPHSSSTVSGSLATVMESDVDSGYDLGLWMSH
jgi:hypothetical protein